MLLAPTVTALQTLLEVCRVYAGPHDIVCNTTKTACMLVRLSNVEEFRYLGDIMNADCRDDKDIENQWAISWSMVNLQLTIRWSECSHLHQWKQKANCSSHIGTPLMDVLFGVIHTRTLLENLQSVIVTHSSVLLTSPHTPARVWHLR